MFTIFVTKPPFKIFTDEVLGLKSKSTHIVSPAIPNDSYAKKYLVDFMGMPLNQLSRHCLSVENANEPGCLYPDYFFTLFPTYSTKVNLDFCLEETMKAQEQYFKTETMVFAFDKGSWPDLELVKNALQNKINEWVNANRITHLKACYFFE